MVDDADTVGAYSVVKIMMVPNLYVGTNETIVRMVSEDWCIWLGDSLVVLLDGISKELIISKR